MGDLTTLHKTARSLILSLRDGIEKLEKSENVRTMWNNHLGSLSMHSCLDLLKKGWLFIVLLCRC